MTNPLLMATLMLMPVISRWAMVYAVFAHPYTRPSGLGVTFKQGANWLNFVLATLFTLGLILGVAWLAHMAYFYLVGLAVILGVWVIVALVAIYLKSKLAGLTGDTYGAINELAEVSVLILVSLLAHNQWLGLT